MYGTYMLGGARCGSLDPTQGPRRSISPKPTTYHPIIILIPVNVLA